MNPSSSKYNLKIITEKVKLVRGLNLIFVTFGLNFWFEVAVAMQGLIGDVGLPFCTVFYVVQQVF